MENGIVEYDMPLTAVQVKAQVQLIQEVMASVMVKDVHYGTIPGTGKPTLYKPGSEKILTTFHIAAYPKEVDDLSTFDEIRYRVKVHGLSMNDGRLIGVGIGECSSNEEKYRWRKPVCDQEFNETPEDRRREVWKKYDGNVYKAKQVRMNPSDVANTILKMAKKRAQIDMTLTATGASDVFDQDLEDLSPEVRDSVAKKGVESKPPIKQPQKKAKEPASGVEVQTLVFDIIEKKGESKGKPWVKYAIHGDNGIEYNTFSGSFADLASTAMKEKWPVTITFQTGQYGNDISDLSIVEVAG